MFQSKFKRVSDWGENGVLCNNKDFSVGDWRYIVNKQRC